MEIMAEAALNGNNANELDNYDRYVPISALSRPVLNALSSQTDLRLFMMKDTKFNSILFYLYSAKTIELSQGALQSAVPGPP